MNELIDKAMTNKQQALEKIAKCIRFTFYKNGVPATGNGFIERMSDLAAEEIIKTMPSLGMIFKAQDQSLPENPYEKPDPFIRRKGEDDLYFEGKYEAIEEYKKLLAGWVKVKKE